VTYLVTTTPASARPSPTIPDRSNTLTCRKRTQRDCLRRTCGAWHADEDLQTAAETEARLAITQLDRRYQRDKEALEQQLRSAAEEQRQCATGFYTPLEVNLLVR
jgi:hypothetical protein